MDPAEFRTLVHIVMDRYPEDVFPEPDGKADDFLTYGEGDC